MRCGAVQCRAVQCSDQSAAAESTVLTCRIFF
eukprot:COSAG06_NODE_19163_length_851_cov_0.638298_2_plen_31_part_01